MANSAAINSTLGELYGSGKHSFYVAECKSRTWTSMYLTTHFSFKYNQEKYGWKFVSTKSICPLVGEITTD